VCFILRQTGRLTVGRNINLTLTLNLPVQLSAESQPVKRRLSIRKEDFMCAVVTVNLRVLKNSGKVLSSCTIGGFSRRAQLH
jgi:hypothetical protein